MPIPRQGSWGRYQNYVRHACPLLSKYGISPAIGPGTVRGMVTRLKRLHIHPSQHLSVYTNGKFYSRSDVIKLQEVGASITSGLRDRYPLIISPIALQIDSSNPNAAFEAR